MSKITFAKIRPILFYALQTLILAVFAVVIVLQSEWISRAGNKAVLRYIVSSPLQFWIAAMLVFGILIFFSLAIGSIDFGCLVCGVLLTVFSSVNYVKILTRSEPIEPWDFGALDQAVKIMPRISITIPWQSFASLIFNLLLFALLFFLYKKQIFIRIKKKWPLRTGGLLLVSLALFAFTTATFVNDQFLSRHEVSEDKSSQIDGYSQNGLITSFMMNLKYMHVSTPENYSRQSVEQAIGRIEKAKTSGKKPNIIILQDESFFDANELKNVTYGCNIIPTLNKLRGSSISGFAMTPIFGGGTCNSEFEVITGFSYAYLPVGSIPYQQYIKKPTFSYASYLKGLGYTTVAIHSYDGNFYNRRNVFNNIGFDKFVSDTGFKNPDIKRGKYISDLDTVKMITTQYEENQKTGKPFFNLTITMQNHQTWSKGEYPKSEEVPVQSDKLSEDEKGVLATYVTGVKEADEALNYLTDYFSKVDEPTIILFYGDHLPALGGIYTGGGILDGDPSSPESIQKLHSTPYVIWNNFENKYIPNQNMSMYELVAYMTQCFDLPRPLYYDYLLQQAKTYKGQADGVFIRPDNTPTTVLPASGQYFYDTQYLFEYDLLFGSRYGSELTR